jgi:thioredoxin reductase/SAM-dependent methyltransferase
VVIVGGGAAGLSAALTLGRVRRSVVVIDAGEPRNAPAAHAHGFLSRDGIPPLELLALGRAEIEGYGAEVLDGRAVKASTDAAGLFVVQLDDGTEVRGRRLLVTTGLVDELPPIGGLSGQWGHDVLHCPYCHGWEVQDQILAVISTGPMAVHQALLFRQMSPHVTLYRHTGPTPDAHEQAQLAALGIEVVDGTVTEVVVEDGHVTGVRVGDEGDEGEVRPAEAVVVGPRFVARSQVLHSLGLEPEEHPSGTGTHIPADPLGATAVPGVWVAGNVTDPKATVVVSAAAGSMAAAAINADLVAEHAERAVALASGTAEAGTGADGSEVPPVMDEAFWDERYRSAPQIWSGNPNPHLVSGAEELTPGRALDVGAGEGADAIWLAEQGWQVTAVDISEVALERGRAEAERRGADIAGRITWVHADVLGWEPPVAAFDLVTLQFIHLPSGARRPLYEHCAQAVAPGGVLLIAAHHPSDMHSGARRPPVPDMFFTAEDLAGELPDGFAVLTADARPRPAHDPDGNSITIHDTVLVARRS